LHTCTQCHAVSLVWDSIGIAAGVFQQGQLAAISEVCTDQPNQPVKCTQCTVAQQPQTPQTTRFFSTDATTCMCYYV
jgi:hypothetical protein